MAELKPKREQDGRASKEGTITILSTLKCFPEVHTFQALSRYFYNSNPDISCAAIKSSAISFNRGAVPHLFKLLDKGPLPVKIEAARALSVIDHPSTLERLINYFPLFQDIDVKREILRAVNIIASKHDRVAELNRGVLIDEGQDVSLKEIAVQGVVDAGDYPFLTYYLPHTSSSIQYRAFYKILQPGEKGVSDLLMRLEGCAQTFSDTPLGLFLCIYLLKVRNPKNDFILQHLQNKGRVAILSFLGAISLGLEHIPSIKKVFRLLLLIPYGDIITETSCNNVLKEVIDYTHRRFPTTMSELITLTSVHIDTLYKKVRKSLLSLKGVGDRDALLIIRMARLFEKTLPAVLLEEVQNFFKAEKPQPPGQIIDKIRGVFVNEEEEDRKNFDSFVHIFSESERIRRLSIYSTLKKIKPEIPVLLKRFSRVLKVVGWLGVKTLTKKVWEILEYARQERMVDLERTCIITLCELEAKNMVLDLKQSLNDPARGIDVQKAFIHGARYLPPESVVDSLLAMFFHPAQENDTKCFILETMKYMDLSKIKKISSELIRVFDPGYDQSLRELAGDILARYVDSTLFHTLVDLTRSSDIDTKITSMRIFREMKNRGIVLPMDILTNRLYLLLEDQEKQVRIEAMFTLIELGDDYAVKILKDWLESHNDPGLPLLLHRVKGVLTSELLGYVLDLVRLENISVQKALRDLLPDICEGRFAEEVKDRFYRYLDILPGRPAAVDAKERAGLHNSESLLHQPKIEFKFKREYTQVLTVFFIDIAGYTDRSTRVDMSTLMNLVGAFEGIVIPLIKSYNGQIIKKMGDGILAVYKHPVNAAVASLKIQAAVNDHNRYSVGEERFFVRIGLHTGQVIRKTGDVYGDVVNIASRMESAARPGDILVTETTYREIKEHIQCKYVGKIKVKGVREGVVAYSPEKASNYLDEILKMRDVDIHAFLNLDKNGALERLKESLFSPQFRLPDTLKLSKGLPANMKELFFDMSNAVEEISHDYHEEYVFKKYLQDKWEEIISQFLRPPE
jgi:class 3 adenylate cyclase